MKTMDVDTPHMTHGSIFDDQELFEIGKGAELKAKSKILRRLKVWLTQSGLSVTAAARRLGVTPAQMKEVRRGNINALDLGQLIHFAARAGLKPELNLQGEDEEGQCVQITDQTGDLDSFATRYRSATEGVLTMEDLRQAIDLLDRASKAHLKDCTSAWAALRRADQPLADEIQSLWPREEVAAQWFCRAKDRKGFTPVFTDTYEKADRGPEECSCRSEARLQWLSCRSSSVAADVSLECEPLSPQQLICASR